MDAYKQQRILVEHNLIGIPSVGAPRLTKQQLATIFSNITYYGFALSEAAYARVAKMDAGHLEEWWSSLEKTLKAITGADKKMDRFVVYKNFPQEVLDMSEAEYWFKQILMYWGFPNEMFTKEEKDRETAIEKLPVKVLQLANDDSLVKIFDSLLRSSVRWTDRQWETVCELLGEGVESANISSISFKENMVMLAQLLIEKGYLVRVNTATDVLRLAVGMSDGDVSLRTNSRFRRFCRSERRFLLSLLDNCRNLEEDVARRRGQFKRFFFELHPGDYKSRFKNVVAVYDKLYRGAKIRTFNSDIERMLGQTNPEALDLLKTRPGEFLRRLHVALSKYGDKAASAFAEVMPKLTVHQLVKIERFLLTVNDRLYRTFPPKGNWTKLQVVLAKERLDDELVLQLAETVASEVASRMSEFVSTVKLSKDVEKVKLQTSDSDLTPYGRGTVFDIPENITFLRSASYWKTGGGHYANIWYDNGWNFFDAGWRAAGTCCWNSERIGDGAIFSGDPTNSKEWKGRACQMIDLYPDKLLKRGIRYAVWNILCYSHQSFDEAEEVHAALQWGEKPQKNKLFEPSRCVFSFPVRGANMTKYIAYIDLLDRKLVYIDANLYGNVSSAVTNTKTLEEKMPAFVEYLNALPSVFDLFKGLPVSEDGMPVLYEDSEEEIEEGQAFVFMQRNEKNTFDQVDINELLKK